MPPTFTAVAAGVYDVAAVADDGSWVVVTVPERGGISVAACVQSPPLLAVEMGLSDGLEPWVVVDEAGMAYSQQRADESEAYRWCRWSTQPMDGITDASVFCISESGHRDHADRDLLARGRLARTAASQEVVLRVHFKPVIGFFDARDDFRRFFHRFSATACGADPLDFDVLRQQLSAASPNGAYVETEELGDARITAASGLQGFEPRIEAPLLFVEQAEEQHDGRP